ncbi:MAG: ATP-binding protein [Clostridia bacterium]|nr:ATP-binding protein [Clostridia bacterium]
MNYFSLFSTYLHFTLQCFIGSFLFTFTLQKRSRFIIRIVCCAVVTVLLLFGLTGIRYALNDYGDIVDMVCFALICIPMNVLWLWICYKDLLWNIIFCAVFGLLVRQGTIKILEAMRGLTVDGTVIANLLGGNGFTAQLLQNVIIIAVYVAVWFIFGRKYKHGDNVYKNSRRLLPLYAAVAFIIPVLSMTEGLIKQTEPVWYVLLTLSESVFCFLIIAIQFGINGIVRLESNKIVADELLMQSQKQYELLKENIEIINLKCHDLRHQIRSLKNGNVADNQFINDLENSISIYDSTINTGNEILDVILTDKSLRCNANGIQFMCIADGKSLGFMEDMDINSLFGNAIENAFEYETTLEEKEKRFISLNVNAEGRLLFICVENYFEGALKIVDGLPITTKNDKQNHGFGMTSIRRTVDKYGGSLQIKTEDNLFSLNICIPLEE